MKHDVCCIDHVNIVVNSPLDVMTRFYRDVMGMEVFKTATIEGEWVDEVVGLTGVRAHVVFLKLSGETSLELLEYERPKGQQVALLGRPNTYGIRHFAFRVAEIESLVGRCREQGVQFASEVRRVPTSQVQFDDGYAAKTKKLCYLYDPDGNLLEFCSYS